MELAEVEDLEAPVIRFANADATWITGYTTRSGTVGISRSRDPGVKNCDRPTIPTRTQVANQSTVREFLFYPFWLR